ncbi:mgtA regulatory leader peptide MgtL [Escherichia coli]|nr:mgtA regulatory leader peptide MgtL [Escherichia coli]
MEPDPTPLPRRELKPVSYTPFRAHETP